MNEQTDDQAEAARSAAQARRAIAEKISALVANAEVEADALLILQLSEAYAYLASEPPRARAT